MLRLVHPAPAGQGTDPPKRRRGSRSAALGLTPEEVRHVRAVLRNTARAYGGLDCLSTVMGVPTDTLEGVLYRRKHLPSGTLAIRLACAAGLSVEVVLSGALNPAGRCPTCGHRVGNR